MKNILLIIAAQSLYIAPFSLKYPACIILVTRSFSTGIAVSLTGSAYWVTNVIIAQVTPVLLASTLQTFGTFYLLGGVHIAAILFVLLTLPETKVKLVSVKCVMVMNTFNRTVSNLQGETLERIELLFSKPWLERINLAYYLR